MNIGFAPHQSHFRPQKFPTQIGRMAELADRLQGSAFFKNLHTEFFGGASPKDMAGFPFDGSPGGDGLAGIGVNG